MKASKKPTPATLSNCQRLTGELTDLTSLAKPYSIARDELNPSKGAIMEARIKVVPYRKTMSHVCDMRRDIDAYFGHCVLHQAAFDIYDRPVILMERAKYSRKDFSTSVHLTILAPDRSIALDHVNAIRKDKDAYIKRCKYLRCDFVREHDAVISIDISSVLAWS